MSFKTEVVADSGGQWVGNGLRFATQAEADAYVHDLMMRWMAVTRTRVVEVSDEPTTHRWNGDRAEVLA